MQYHENEIKNIMKKDNGDIPGISAAYLDSKGIITPKVEGLTDEEYDLPLMIREEIPTLEKLKQEHQTPPILYKSQHAFYFYGYSESGEPQLTELDKTLKELNAIDFQNTPKIHISSRENRNLYSEIRLKNNAHYSMTTVTAESVFGAASLSKPVFAYLVLKLLEKNKLGDFDLDTPLCKILPLEDLSIDPQDAARAKILTARMILSQRSGLPITHHPERDGPLKFEFDPDTEYGYSGVGIAYLQKVVEKLTSSNLEALAKEHVFIPNEMHHSSFIGDKNKPREAQAANSLHTTPTDYAKLIHKWINDKSPIMQSAFQPARAKDKQVLNMTNDEWATQMNVPIEDCKHLAWGLGWGLEIDDAGNTTRAYHTGDMNEWRAVIAIDLEDKDNKKAIVYFANARNGDVLADEIITPNVTLKHAINYVSTKYGFAVKDEPNWKALEQARYDLITIYIKGCNLHFMHNFPNNPEDLEKYKNSFILCGRELCYITPNKEIEAVPIKDFNQLLSNLDTINPTKSEKIHLSSRQIKTYITSNGGYTHLKLQAIPTDQPKPNSTTTMLQALGPSLPTASPTPETQQQPEPTPESKPAEKTGTLYKTPTLKPYKS